MIFKFACLFFILLLLLFIEGMRYGCDILLPLVLDDVSFYSRSSLCFISSSWRI